MRGKLILVGIFAGFAASIPVFYQANPAAFHAFVRSIMNSDQPSPSADNEPAPETPAMAASLEPEPLLGRRVRVPLDKSGHYTAEFRLNGARLDAMVDTGATYVALNASTARRIGLILTPGDFVHPVRTANGTTKAAAAMIDDLRIGKIDVGKVQAVILDDRALSNTLIGMSFLNRLSKFEVGNDGLILEQ